MNEAFKMIIKLIILADCQPISSDPYDSCPFPVNKMMLTNNIYNALDLVGIESCCGVFFSVLLKCAFALKETYVGILPGQFWPSSSTLKMFK